MAKRFIIWHNPRCSKSREALALLEAEAVDLEVRNYLEDPPTVEELRETLRFLGKRASDIVRRGEAIFGELHLADADEGALLAAMAAHPILIERPILIAEDRAVVGRPPSAVKSLL
jgi:arsenate reductase (glutaredoxin)